MILTKYRVSIVLTTVSLWIWSLSLFQAELVIGEPGIISSFPISFFVALALLTIAAALLWTNKEKHHWLLCCQIVILILSLYLTPYLLEGTPRFPVTYQSYGFVEYTLRTGHINADLVWYHSWPGFTLLFTQIFSLLGVEDPLFIMAVHPAIFQLLLLFPLFIISRAAYPDIGNRWTVIAWIFILANWTGQDYFSSQAMAFILLLFIVYLGLKEAKIFTILLVIFFLTLTITHALTAIVALLAFIGFNLGYKFANRRFRFIVLILMMIIFFQWSLWGINSKVLSASEAFSSDVFLSFIFIPRLMETSAEHAAINTIRIVYTASFYALATIGYLTLSAREKRLPFNRSMLLFAALTLILLPLFAYGGEVLIRILIFSLLPISCFAAMLVRDRRLALIGITCLLAFLPFHLVAHYGNERVEYIRPGEVDASEFIFQNTTGGTIVGLLPPVFYQGWGKYDFMYIPVVHSDPDFDEAIIDVIKKADNKSPTIVDVAYRMDDKYAFIDDRRDFVEDIQHWLQIYGKYNLIYSNSDAEIYIS